MSSRHKMNYRWPQVLPLQLVRSLKPFAPQVRDSVVSGHGPTSSQRVQHSNCPLVGSLFVPMALLVDWLAIIMELSPLAGRLEKR